jgi:hypothetical protein
MLAQISPAFMSSLAAYRRLGPSRTLARRLSSATKTDRGLRMSITRTSRDDERRQRCFPRMRHAGLRRISPSCRSYCGKNKKRCDPVQRGRSKRETSLIRLCTVPQFAICPAHNERVLMEQKCYVLRKTQPFVGCRTEPSGWSARFYIGALCNSAIKLAAPQKAGPLFFCGQLRTSALLSS